MDRKRPIAQMRNRYQTGTVALHFDRARQIIFAKLWKRPDAGRFFAPPDRLAMKNVYENRTHYVDPDDRIAGYWTEYFLGIPVDIERGVFNSVLAAELDRKRC